MRFGTILIGLQIFLIIFILLIAVSTHLPYLFTYGTGESMQPTMDSFTFTLVDQTGDTSDIREGDIIRFETDCEQSFTGNDVVVHRVIEVTDDGIITEGDNNDYVDQDIDCIDNVTSETYRGTVVEYWNPISTFSE